MEGEQLVLEVKRLIDAAKQEDDDIRYYSGRPHANFSERALGAFVKDNGLKIIHLMSAGVK